MEFSRRTAQLLHEEHHATIELLERLEGMIARARRTAPDASNPQIREILEQVNAAIEQDVRGHFAFEENQLFTRLAEFGDAAIGEHLRQEHQAILPLAEQAMAIATSALSDGFSADSWNQFRSTTGELIERMLAHIQKEEMALLPILDELLDPETDMELAGIYSMENQSVH